MNVESFDYVPEATDTKFRAIGKVLFTELLRLLSRQLTLC